MHLEFLVEEASAEAALKNLIPKIISPDVTFDIHPYEGKTDLIKKIPKRLKGYTHWIPIDWRIVVLIDQDQQDCLMLKQTLEQAAQDAGLITKTSVKSNCTFLVLNRIAIEELEAWFFGDVEAIQKAYPRIPSNLDLKAKFRIPDAITGGTWEALEKVLQKSGYYKGGLPKVETARNISSYMNPHSNRSRSFQVFRDGLLSLK